MAPKNKQPKDQGKCFFCGRSAQLLNAKGLQAFTSPLPLDVLQCQVQPLICETCLVQLALALKRNDSLPAEDRNLKVHPAEARELKDIGKFLQDVAIQHDLGLSDDPAGDG